MFKRRVRLCGVDIYADGIRSSKFSEEQIISILAEQDRDVPTADVRRKYGVSATFYKWKAKYGGLDGEA